MTAATAGLSQDWILGLRGTCASKYPIVAAQIRLFDELAENVDQCLEPNAKNPLQGQRLGAEEGGQPPFPSRKTDDTHQIRGELTHQPEVRFAVCHGHRAQSLLTTAIT